MSRSRVFLSVNMSCFGPDRAWEAVASSDATGKLLSTAKYSQTERLSVCSLILSLDLGWLRGTFSTTAGH